MVTALPSSILTAPASRANRILRRPCRSGLASPSRIEDDSDRDGEEKVRPRLCSTTALANHPTEQVGPEMARRRFRRILDHPER